MLSSRRTHVQPSPTAAASCASSSQWSARDKECLQRTLDPLHNEFRKQPMGFLRSEGSTLLCTPPAEVYDRLTSMLSNISIVSGLVLSAIAGAALSPLDLDKFPTEKRLAAEIFNVVAALTIVVQACVVLYSTFTLYILISSAHSPTAVYRALTHMTRWIGIFEFMTFVPALGCFALIVIACHLHCSVIAARFVLIATGALVLSFQLGFNHMCQSAFPYNAWAWTSVFGGVYWLLPRPFGASRAHAKAHGELLLAQAREGVLGALDQDGDYVLDGDDERSEKATHDEAELNGWISQAELELSPTQRGLLVRALLAEGLTHARMREAVQHPGGFQTLCEMLASSELRMRPGERLALASAVMRGGGVSSSPTPS